jgi:hypothetical protein
MNPAELVTGSTNGISVGQGKRQTGNTDPTEVSETEVSEMSQNGPKVQEIATLGKLFSDGIAIERLRGGRLVIGHGGKELTAPEFVHDGCRYMGAPLDPSLEVILPPRSEPYGSLVELMADVEQAFVQLLAVDERTAFLFANFAASSWVAEALPAAPVMNFWGAAGADSRAVNALAIMCRRGLVLAQPSIADLLRLPPEFSPTLLVRPSSLRPLAPWLSTVTSSDAQILRDGALLQLRHPVAIFSRAPIAGAGLSVPLPPEVGWRPLSAQEREELIDQFQSRFLSFRLQRHLAVKASRFDVPEFAPELRMQAATLGATLEGAPELQRRLMAALRCADEDDKANRSQTQPAIVLEAVLALCHEGHPRVYVGQIAALANTIFAARGEAIVLSDRGTGEILRGQLGLSATRRAVGHELLLDNTTARHVHQLARGFGALSLLTPLAGCAFCQDLLQDARPTSDIGDVQDIHNVHDIHDIDNLHGERENNDQ